MKKNEIKDISDNGKLITLKDNSEWKITGAKAFYSVWLKDKKSGQFNFIASLITKKWGIKGLEEVINNIRKGVYNA